MDNARTKSPKTDSKGGMKVGDIVVSLAGHDTGDAFIVISEVSADFVLIADGKSRTLENPKLKRKRHLRVVAEGSAEGTTNASLKKRLKKFNSDRRLYAEK